MKIFSSLLFAIAFLPICGQHTISDTTATLHTIPGLQKAKSEKDLGAFVSITVSADSIFFDVDVVDDDIRSGIEKDRIEIWFGSPWLDFSDFITAESKNKSFIFRNSAEAGDNADLKRFINDADYPKAQLLHPETGEQVQSIVPHASSLKREHIFVGLTRFIIPAEGSDIFHANREKYQAFSVQTGLEVADLSQFIRVKSKRTENGYHKHVAMSNVCLGFARAVGTDKIRYAVDVYDADSETEAEVGISTSKNRFYARAGYMNELSLPFSLKTPVLKVDSEFIEALGIKQDLVYTKKGWQPYGWGYSNIVYAKDIISEAGLTEFYFYNMDLSYTEGESPVKWQKLEVSYDDMTLFHQHEVYLKVFNEVLSGKKYRYTGVEKDKFFYSIVAETDTSVLIPVYDYEPVDPLGFGEFGHTADEFVFIQRITANKNQTIFNLGQRIEAANKIAIGNEEPTVINSVNSASYQWQEQGKSFRIAIKGLQKTNNQTLLIEKNKSGFFGYP